MRKSHYTTHTEADPNREYVSIRNLALHPTKPMRPLPRSKWRRALLVLRGYEIYGD